MSIIRTKYYNNVFVIKYLFVFYLEKLLFFIPCIIICNTYRCVINFYFCIYGMLQRSVICVQL